MYSTFLHGRDIGSECVHTYCLKYYVHVSRKDGHAVIVTTKFCLQPAVVLLLLFPLLSCVGVVCYVILSSHKENTANMAQSSVKCQ